MKRKHYYSFEDNKTIYQRIRANIPIQDYAASRGFQICKKGSYYQIIGEKGKSDFSSVMINSKTNRYARYAYSKEQKSIIDFVMELDGCDEQAAVIKLKPLIDTYDLSKTYTARPKKISKNAEFVLPTRADTIKNVYAYLTKTRCINKNIVDNFIWNNNLYQDERNNCVFVSYNRQGQAKFCNKRGSSTKSNFKQDVPGSDYEHCFFIDNGSDTLIVTESVIDCMSVMSIMEDRGKIINKYSYIALSGTGKWEAVGNILKENPCVNTVILSCDNDEGGFRAMDNIKNLINSDYPSVNYEYFLPKTENDWNEQLKFNHQHKLSTKDYLRMKTDEILAYGRDAVQTSNIIAFNAAI